MLYVQSRIVPCFSVFFFNDTATTAIYTLSLHDALPICSEGSTRGVCAVSMVRITLCSCSTLLCLRLCIDRKSTRLNSSHVEISYAVFCLKKKKRRVRSTPES